MFKPLERNADLGVLVPLGWKGIMVEGRHEKRQRSSWAAYFINKARHRGHDIEGGRQIDGIELERMWAVEDGQESRQDRPAETGPISGRHPCCWPFRTRRRELATCPAMRLYIYVAEAAKPVPCFKTRLSACLRLTWCRVRSNGPRRTCTRRALEKQQDRGRVNLSPRLIDWSHRAAYPNMICGCSLPVPPSLLHLLLLFLLPLRPQCSQLTRDSEPSTLSMESNLTHGCANWESLARLASVPRLGLDTIRSVG
jgi:hypothetical protein